MSARRQGKTRYLWDYSASDVLGRYVFTVDKPHEEIGSRSGVQISLLPAL